MLFSGSLIRIGWPLEFTLWLKSPSNSRGVGTVRLRMSCGRRSWMNSSDAKKMKPEEAKKAFVDFCKELLDTKHVSDGTFQNAINAFGEKGVVDLVALTGYYQMVSALLNVDRYPLPTGAKPELAALR